MFWWLWAPFSGPHLPLPAYPPAATFAQLCLVFSCLPSLGGGGGDHEQACTWASARGERAKQPHTARWTGGRDTGLGKATLGGVAS